MPILKRPDGVIHDQTYGEGFPVLLFAPGGLRSRMEMWPAPPGGPLRSWVDWTQALPEAGFSACPDQASDQRCRRLGATPRGPSRDRHRRAISRRRQTRPLADRFDHPLRTRAT